jgi:hypothetical protein
MKKMRSALLCAFWIVHPLIAFSGTIEAFKSEAENALGKQIVIKDGETGTYLGLTNCDRNPVLIVMHPGMNADLHESVLAHELGHALICAAGITTDVRLTPAGRALDAAGLLSNLSVLVGSCFIDPVADASAKSHGFDPTMAADATFDKLKAHPTSDWIEGSQNLGRIWPRYAAAVLYCAEIRKHTRSSVDVENRFGVVPEVLNDLRQYKQTLGTPECHEANECVHVTIALRDAVGLRGLAVVKNPATNLYE